MNTLEYEYELKFNYDEEKDDPAQIFDSLSKLVKSFKKIDEDIYKSVSNNISIQYKLIGIEKGSLRNKLLSKVILMDDEGSIFPPLEKDNVDKYIKETRKIVVERVSKIGENNPQIFDEIVGDINNIANETGISESPSYAPIVQIELAKDLKDLTSTINDLSESEDLTFANDEISADIPKGNIVSIQDVVDLLTDETLTHERTEILKIKKPDFLGNSKWTIKIADKQYDVDIIDEDWINKFHAKEFYIGPGDSMKAKIKVTDTYNKNRDLTNKTVVVIKIHNVVKGRVDE